MIEGPEVEAHRHRTGHSRADLILALLAILLSCVSVFIAVRHGETMERLVQANSWPNLSIGSSNQDDAHQRVITFDVQNTGVGPARIDSVEVFYEGKAYPGPTELLRACCGAGPRINFSTSALRDEVLPARDTIHPLAVTPGNMGEDVWSRLNSERFKMAMRICYCSVFEECYVRDTRAHRPEHVAQCTPSQPVEFLTY